MKNDVKLDAISTQFNLDELNLYKCNRSKCGQGSIVRDYVVLIAGYFFCFAWSAISECCVFYIDKR